MSRRGKRTCPLDLKLGHNNWLRQVKEGRALGQGSVSVGALLELCAGLFGEAGTHCRFAAVFP